MKNIINKLDDTIYIILMGCILLLIFIYSTPYLYLPFTIIAVLYFYIKDNQSQKLINMLTTQGDEESIFFSKKIIIILFFIFFCYRYGLYMIVALIFPMFLYLHVRFAYKSNKLIKFINNIYMIIHIIYILYLNIHVFFGDYLNFIEISPLLVILVLSAIYTIILSYFIGKKTMFLHLFLSIIPILIIFSIWGVFFSITLIVIFIMNYIFIYYKQYLFAFIFQIHAIILKEEYVFPIIFIALILFLLFSNDKHNTPSISKTVEKDEQD